MRLTHDSLAFPVGRPSPYVPLVDEPIFDSGKHLALEQPDHSATLQELGYSADEVNACASSFAYRMANALVTSLDTTLVRVESECGRRTRRYRQYRR